MHALGLLLPLHVSSAPPRRPPPKGPGLSGDSEAGLSEVFLRIIKRHTQVGELLCLESTWAEGGVQEAPSAVTGPPGLAASPSWLAVDPIPFLLDLHSSAPHPTPLHLGTDFRLTLVNTSLSWDQGLLRCCFKKKTT